MRYTNQHIEIDVANADQLDQSIFRLKMFVFTLVASRRRRSTLLADNKLMVLQQAHRIPVTEWKARHVLAWLEIDMKMAAYGQACFDNIKSGKVSFFLTHKMSWRCGSVVGRQSLAGGLTLIYGWHVTTAWVKFPLWVNLPG